MTTVGPGSATLFARRADGLPTGGSASSTRANDTTVLSTLWWRGETPAVLAGAKTAAPRAISARSTPLVKSMPRIGAVTNVPTWLAAVAILVPAFTALGGYWLAGRNEERRDARTAERERRQRRDLLADKLEERRHEFQLGLLLELQDVVRRFVRAGHKVARFDQEALRTTGKFSRLGSDLDGETYDAGVDLGRLRVRVLDVALRRDLDELHSQGTRLELSYIQLENVPPDRAIAELEGRLRAQGEAIVRITDRIGELVRAELLRTPDSLAP